MTELLHLRDADLRDVDATVTAVDGDRVTLDRTVFHPNKRIRPEVPD